MLPSIGLVPVRVANDHAPRSGNTKDAETGVGVHRRCAVCQVLFSKKLPVLFSKVGKVRLEVGGLKSSRKMAGIPLVNHQSDVDLVEQGEFPTQGGTHRHVTGCPVAQSGDDKQEDESNKP